MPGGWESIQAKQQGTYRPAPIDLSKPSKKLATDKDKALLTQHGAQGLRDLGLYGVLNRLDIPFNL